jgi:DMSO/TMAO reductase YedYZ molybdopterin-dependent catalytic subunit
VGGAIIDNVPESLKHFAITLFGTHDKLALQVGMLVLLGLAGAGLGLLARTRLPWALAGIGAFALLGVAAAVTRYQAGPLALLPSLAAGATGVFVLYRLTVHDRVDLAVVVPDEGVQTGAEAGTTTARSTRRRALTAGAVVLGLGGGRGGTRPVVFAAARRQRGAGKRDASAARVAGATAAGGRRLQAAADVSVRHLEPAVLPDRHRACRAPDRPRRLAAARAWPGPEPLTLTYDDLLKRPMIERYITLCCVSNEVGGGLISNARWLGVRVSDLLAEADPEPGADQVVSRSGDGYTAGTPTEVLRDGRDAILAVGMNGEPLPIDHGFPVRMVVPGLYGYVSATKWLTELELTSFADFDAYWVRRGWANKAPIKLQSRIDTPGSRAKAGTVGRRRGRVGPARRGVGGGTAGGQRRLAAGEALRRPLDRHLAPVDGAVAGHAGQPHVDRCGPPTRPGSYRTRTSGRWYPTARPAGTPSRSPSSSPANSIVDSRATL